MSKEKLNLRVRDMIEDDAAFVYSSLLKSHRYSRSTAGTQNEIYYANHHKLVENMIKSCKVLILCDQGDLGHIYGYGIAEEVQGIFTVHFIYVKQPYRGLGLAKLIFKHLGGKEDIAFCYSHRTKKVEDYEKKYVTAVYHPYLAYKYYGDSHGRQKVEEKEVSKSKRGRKQEEQEQ